MRIIRSIARTLAARDTADLPATWSRYCALRGEPITLLAEATSSRGICRGIQPDGALLVETDSGMRTVYSATQVRLASQ